MKSRVWLVTIAVLFVTTQAYGAFTDTNESTTASSTWTKVTVTVQTKVQEWKDWWYGKNAQPATEVAQPATPKGTGSQAMGAGTGTTTAPAQTTVKTEPVQAARPAPTEEQTALRNQPLFTEKAQGASLTDVRALRDQVKTKNVLGVAKPGRAGTSKLAKSKAGVPTVDWKKVKINKTIPRLDIGTENLISRNDFEVSQLSWGLQKPSELKRLPSPGVIAGKELSQALGMQVAKAGVPKGLQANLQPAGKPVTREVVDKVKYTMQDVKEVKPLPYNPLTEDQLKMVAALILFEKGNQCHMVMGLFHQLAQLEKTKQEATYHLGACADQLQMNQAAFDSLSGLVSKEDKEYAKDALKLLAKDLPIVYERDFYKMMTSAKAPKQLITDESRDDVTYRMAKGAYRAGDFKTSLIYVDQVSEGSEYYDDARFLSAMNSFALKDKKNALRKLETLWKSIEARKEGNSNIRALTAVNLARMHFAMKNYNKALDLYMQVPKDHALWVQALVEQGWTQLALNDFSGAIGNMYSLHSPYFKAVYQPESFVVRTIGYLNICQYGDAYKTLTWMEHDYRDMYDKTSAYLKTKGQPVTVYNTVKSYIRGKSDQSVDGVPYQVWREMARRKDFLNLQVALNDKLDEAKRYEGVNEKIKTEKASIRFRADNSKKQFDIWSGKIAKAKADKGMAKDLDQSRNSLKLERDRTIAYRFQLSILEQSRQGYLDFQKKSQAKLDQTAAAVTTKAGEALLKRASVMQSEMEKLLENNEFLRYEVFAGSGENIRYQVAGGEVSGQVNRIPANVKPTKMMNWNFDGEYWEDEIGSYRSSLQNNCPASARVPAATKEKAEQAKLNEDYKGE